MKPKTLLVAQGCIATILGVGLATATASLGQEVSKPAVRTVRGEVVAVNIKDSPQVIVVKAMTAKRQELIVGATVESGTAITRGKARVSLDSIKIGDSVALTYVKSLDGLAARSIHVR